MIRIILGTKAQLIKMAPVIRELDDREMEYSLVMTGQHHETMQDLLDLFQLRPPDIALVDNMEADTKQKALFWLFKVLRKTGFGMNKGLWQPKPVITLVHGDTLSTLVGAVLSKLAGVRVAHVEAGLRSFNVFHPFPEEIIRILVSRISDVFYCPGSFAAGNISDKPRSEVIDTKSNTLLDSLRLALDIAPKLAAGVVWVNATNLFDAAAGFGGVRESGFLFRT